MTQSEIQAELLEQIPSRQKGLLNLSVRVGKTKLAIDIIKRDKYKKILWVTSEATLRDTTLPKEFKKWKEYSLLKKTIFICYQSLKKYDPKNYDVVLLDEYHKCTPENMQRFTGDIKPVVIGMSGSSPKNREKSLLFQSLGLFVLATLDIDDAVKKDLIAPYKIYLVGCSLDTKPTIHIKTKNYDFYTSEVKSYAFASKKIEQLQAHQMSVPKSLAIRRTTTIYGFPSKPKKALILSQSLPGRSLIFFPRIEFADKSGYPAFHSKTDKTNLNKFINNEIDTLACVNSGATGLTFTGIDNLIIVQADSNTLGNVTQKLGRALVKQDNYVAKIYIMYYKNTVDENWARQALRSFNPDNIIEFNI